MAYPIETTDGEPFFLVGSVRSGTTVLRLLLGHHPQICRCDEFEYVASAIAGRLDWPDVPTYVGGLPRYRDFRESGYRPDASLSFPDLARDFLAQRKALDGRSVVGATVHNHYDELPRIWPKAKFIHLDRDPRDVARSCVAMGWAGNAWSGLRPWEQAHDAWQRLRRIVPDDRRLEVKFEDLAADTEAVLVRIAGFLGVTYDPAMLEIERDTTYKRPDPRAADSWRHGAAERDVRELEARLGPRLAQAGYTASGLPPLTIPRLRQLGLRLDNRVGRARFAQRRYGLALWTASFVSRHLLPFKPLRDSAQSAVDKIDERHLK